MSTGPPRLAERLLEWSLPETDRDAVLGDCCEEFVARADRHGTRGARRWYWRQTRRSFLINIRRRAAEALHSHLANSPQARRPKAAFGGGLMNELRYAAE